MRVFKLHNTKTNETFIVSNKQKFCEENGLTRRLLDRTWKGERNHHKGWVLEEKYTFQKTEEGKRILCDSTLKGVLLEKVVPNKKEGKTSLEHSLMKANKKIQVLQDRLRVMRKENREVYRNQFMYDSFYDGLNTFLETEYKDYFENKPLLVTPVKKEKSLVCQVSDWHIGRIIDLNNNKFNFKVARERMLNYFSQIKEYVHGFGIEEITVAFTGDIFQLDSHMDSKLTNEDNRANSFIEGLDILTEFLTLLSKEVKKVSVVGVVGNESRISSFDRPSNVDSVASNNFDAMVFKVLKKLFKHTNVVFLNDGDMLNYVFKVRNHNIAITHGDKLGKHSKEDILKFKARMVEDCGYRIDYVMFGHIHEPMITSNYSRCGCLCGIDGYAFNGLNISGGSASQNIYLVSDNEITGICLKMK